MTDALPGVLLIEDDAALRRSLAQWLSLNELSVTEAADGNEALKVLRSDTIDVVISDVRMPGISGLELLAVIRKTWPELPVIILSGHGDVPMAVAAIQAGAFNFLTKPYVPEQLIGTLQNALEQTRLRRRVVSLEQSNAIQARLERQLLGADQATTRLKSTIEQLAPYHVDVLIKGETGSGKEVVARLLHECSPRQAGPFVAINCAALPLDIVESELFGHETGAFTGASGIRIGKFEFAKGGTIFLDEIESMPLSIQAKLLRALQERTVTRLGSNRDIPIDIRILSATKEDLRDLASRGLFREDLYYRLAAADIAIPPLRDRGHDALLLFEHFMLSMAERLERKALSLTDEETRFLLAYAWPGNVRELKHLAERRALGLDWRPDTDQQDDLTVENSSLADLVDQFELNLIEQALRNADGRTSLAAERLQLPHRTLNEKLKRLSTKNRSDRA
ncbi:sigma-54 dependent transcriptional regulator [Agrobacterium sp. SHOUNA12C]|uniref:C4-dicarboxylate transport transcriptional regulatory protein DctD n=2 Tax=Rhizobium rhizogenes TaxID=359 RepID=B9JNH6_RHIR8|nr:sigma-54 dependent transcriptional regulator [Rhizobium rhizogenes]ACM29107.1 two-component response regulator protein regulating C4-dicarboxylate transport system [Rhizobium rhizogenes K84]KAA6486368.1 sigma-54-dependent Fis family transcriptional regulator [Agrobacterium sp. ICMP 7243]MCJ9719279.1 sigma-54 dependent transcriptional regulator [Agrobacterium sp. BETTINA12B]MCJ9756025.1 sigma-54 dependent transcriptional regulator [Agrobacterium sp. SHOUNA12C]OCI93639.1 sigma-54-dependent Fi